MPIELRKSTKLSATGWLRLECLYACAARDFNLDVDDFNEDVDDFSVDVDDDGGERR